MLLITNNNNVYERMGCWYKFLHKKYKTKPKTTQHILLRELVREKNKQDLKEYRQQFN